MKIKLVAASVVLVAGMIWASNQKIEKTQQSYVAHEWGTFTTVQGADGVQMDWNPFIIDELPEFVYDRNRSDGDRRAPSWASVGSKTARATRVRMETPVIYFYSEEELEVDVHVDFPNGLVTEWYPQATRFGPFATKDPALKPESQKSFVRWEDVRVLPRGQNRPLPHDQSGSHYYAARDTDANTVAVDGGSSSEVEEEGFLFYRGVGHFTVPLKVAMGSDEHYVHLLNEGAEPLSDLVVLAVSEEGARFSTLQALGGKEEHTVKISGKSWRPTSDVFLELEQLMQERLIHHGLYAAEARAMVNTWRDSWFEEKGLRVLYLMPRAWTDRTLPLRLDPAPREVVRVMVGRSELITPRMEWELLKQVVHYAEGNAAEQSRAIEDLAQLGLGRFAEAAARRLLGPQPSREFSEHAWRLVRGASQPKVQ